MICQFTIARILDEDKKPTGDFAFSLVEELKEEEEKILLEHFAGKEEVLDKIVRLDDEQGQCIHFVSTNKDNIFYFIDGIKFDKQMEQTFDALGKE
jgi:hypothetical protein